MKTKQKQIIGISIIIVLAISIAVPVIWVIEQQSQEAELGVITASSDNNITDANVSTNNVDETIIGIAFNNSVESNGSTGSGSGKIVSGSYSPATLVVNKNNCLPSDYAPGEISEARNAFEQMAADASSQGIYLNAFSTYRGYSAQESLYNRYVAADGQAAADRYSARPGCREHQTGLAFDIGGSDSSRWAETTFDGTAEANWLANNAAKYGFILRYPQGKESITGYMHESWHYRYVGDSAEAISQSGLTLEEYLGVN